jgi:hypothetical protein
MILAQKKTIPDPRPGTTVGYLCDRSGYIDVVGCVENFGFNKVNDEVNRVNVITCTLIPSAYLIVFAYVLQESIEFV